MKHFFDTKNIKGWHLLKSHEPSFRTLAIFKIVHIIVINVIFCCALCVEFLMLLFSINSEKLLEVAAPDLNAVIPAMRLVLVHPLTDRQTDLWHVLNSITRCSNCSYQNRFCF